MANNSLAAGSGRAPEKKPAEHQAVLHNQGPLVRALQESLPKATKLLFEKGLLDSFEFQNAQKTNQPEYQRAKEVMKIILNKIEGDVKWYGVLLDVLGSSTKSLQQAATDIDRDLQEEKGRYAFSSSPKKPPRVHNDTSSSFSSPSTYNGYSRHYIRSRSFSDSSLPNLKEKVTANEENDSAFFDITELQNENDRSEGNSANHSFQQVQHNASEEPRAHEGASHEHSMALPSGNSVALPSGNSMALPSGNSVALPHESGSIQSSNAMATPSLSDPLSVANNDDDQQLSMEEETNTQTLAEKSAFEPGRHGMRDIGHAHCQQKIELLKNEIRQCEDEIANLNTKHEVELKNMKAKSDEVSRKLELEVTEKDNIIENLKKDEDNKNQMIRKLRVEKSDIQNQIAKLNEELRKNKETTEAEIKRVQQESQEKLNTLSEKLKRVELEKARVVTVLEDELEKKTAELKKVQESEEKALREVADITKKLSDIQIAKEGERHKYELEKQRLEHEREIIRKDAEKEIAFKDNKLLQSKLQLSEVEKECAKELKEKARESEEAAHRREEAAYKREEEAKEREKNMRMELDSLRKEVRKHSKDQTPN